MRLNTLKPADGAKKTARRVGRGIGSGFGKTCGRGHKGQHSRAGGFHKVGFEGGQMPIQRRLPKRGFKSTTKAFNAKIRTSELNKLSAGSIDLLTLKEANLISELSLSAKVYLSGDVTNKYTLVGIHVTKGAKAAIEKAGGSVKDDAADDKATKTEKPAATKAKKDKEA